jgi:hypothetical protein
VGNLSIKKENQKLTAIPEFDTEDTEVLSIAGKVERGFLNGAFIGIINKEADMIDGMLVVTKSELFEASIVSVPADANAVRLYNEDLEILSVDKLRLSITQQPGKDDFKGYYQQICIALGLDKETKFESVLSAAKSLTKTKGEEDIKQAGELDMISIAEEKLYLKMYRSGQTEVLRIVEEKRKEYEELQKSNLANLYNQNNDKIITCLTVSGWEEIKKLGFESAKKIVDCLPERTFYAKMVKGEGIVQDLDWYRKNNPKALQDNPELYQSLLKAYKQNK